MAESVLEFRFSSPNVVECSTCREAGNRALFPLILGIDDLVIAFKEHVEAEHRAMSRLP